MPAIGCKKKKLSIQNIELPCDRALVNYDHFNHIYNKQLTYKPAFKRHSILYYNHT